MSINNNKLILWKGKPFKNLIYGFSNKGGRNNLGRICSFRKGGGFKKKYRIIDFKRSIINITAVVMRIEYDPNRTAYIALVCYQNGIISYILCVEGLHVGDRIKNYNFLNSYDFVNSSIFSIKGNSLLLKDVPSGSLVCNIELYPGLGSCFCKSAGTFAIVLNKYYINNKFYILVRLPSGIEYLLLENCRVVLGIVSNINYKLISFKKAGKSRNKGIRPVVRGVAKNPVDHPHGGGEGRKSPKRCARSRWGKLSKGIKTRNKKKINKFILRKKNA